MSMDKKKQELQHRVFEQTGVKSLCVACKKKCKDQLPVGFCYGFSLNKSRYTLTD